MVTSFGVSPTVFDVGGKRVVSVASPTANTDATNKEYVDNLVASGLTWKAPVKAASIGNVTLAVALNSLDGVTLAAGDRVLLKDQTTTTQRGVYLLDASKIPQKVDADSTIGDTVFVEGGTTNNDSVYHSNATDTWVLVSKTDTYGVISNGGLEKSGTDFGIKDGAVTNAKLGNGIWISKIDNFAMTQELLWSQMTAADGTATASPYNWFRNLTSAIQELRGTANYNTHNTETIAGAYDLAEVKNRTYRGDTAPSTSGYISGDLYFEGVAI